MTQKIHINLDDCKDEFGFSFLITGCDKLRTYCNGDSEPFSAIARMALSSGVCTFAQAKSNSVKL